MGKKLNTVLFILGATVANVLTMIVVFLAFLLPFIRFMAPELPASTTQVIMIGLFILAVVITYVLYYRAVRYLAGRYNLEKYFEPIFPKKR
jgi:drug/metabolite transporter (DMT)-like permease